MGTMSTKTRNNLSASQFGLPATRQYPVNDKAHAANAKARAAQQVKAGNLSKAQQTEIDTRANRVLKNHP